MQAVKLQLPGVAPHVPPPQQPPMDHHGAAGGQQGGSMEGSGGGTRTPCGTPGQNLRPALRPYGEPMGQEKGGGESIKGRGYVLAPPPFDLATPTGPPPRPLPINHPIEPHRDPRDPQTPWRTYGEANGGVANKGVGLRLDHAHSHDHAHKAPAPTTPPHKPPIEPHRAPCDPQTYRESTGQQEGACPIRGAGLRVGHAPFRYSHAHKTSFHDPSL